MRVAQAVTSRTAETLTPKKHVASFFRWSSTWNQPEWHKRRTQIGRLWGSKKDTFSLPEVQDPMSRWNEAVWCGYFNGVLGKRVLRQAIYFKFVDIKFNIIKCHRSTRVWRQYTVSAKGMEFLGTPYDIFVLDTTHDFLNEQKKQTSLQNVKQSRRARTTSS